MPVAFPSIKPSEREYLPPEYALTQAKSQSGVTSKRLWGSQPNGAEMTLSFGVISNDRAAEILEAWDLTKGGIDFLVLPNAILSGTSDRLAKVMLPSNGTLRWTFAERPTITSVGPSWARARVRLVGELRLS